MKNKIINIRIKDDLRRQLELRASEANTSLSNYARSVLRDNLKFEEKADLNNGKENVPFSKSLRFNFLTTWLFIKYLYPVENNPSDVLQDFKTLIDEAIQDETLSNAFKYEISKVAYDIDRFLNEPDYTGKQFHFPVPNHEGSFDYTVLFNEVWTIYYR